MSKISSVDKIQEFTNDDITYGTYLVIFNGEQKIFVKNGDSVGVVTYYLNEPASKCVSIIRDDVKQDFLKMLNEVR